MTEGGFYLMHRGWFDHAVFSDNDERMLWVWMIEKASFQERQININGNPIKLNRGQLSHSIRFISEAIGCSRQKVERSINKLKRWDMIETAAETGQLVITICNYNQYQMSRDSSETATETHPETNKKERKKERKKELNKDNNIITIKPDDVTDQVWSDFVEMRRKKNAVITEIVINRIRSEAQNAGWTMQDALTEIITRNWQSFKAEWVKKENNYGNQHKNQGTSTFDKTRIAAAQALAELREEGGMGSGDLGLFGDNAGQETGGVLRSSYADGNKQTLAISFTPDGDDA